MVEIFREIRKFLSLDFQVLSYFITFFLLGIIFYLNYFGSSPYFIAQQIFSLDDPLHSVAAFFSLYLTGYLGIFILHLTITKFSPKDTQEKEASFQLIFNHRFIIKIFLGLLLFSTIRIFPLAWLEDYFSPSSFSAPTLKYFYNVGVFYGASGASLVVLSILHFFLEKKGDNFYGLQLSNLKTIFKIYLPIFFLVLPLVILANFNEDLRYYYPLYRPIKEPVFYLSNWQKLTLFELGYGFFLFNTELFFRGFLVISLAREIGKKTILPASFVYALAHLGKPLGEAISSFFGGYILGVMALRHQSIFLGIFIHIILAWLMEITAYLFQNYIFN